MPFANGSTNLKDPTHTKILIAALVILAFGEVYSQYEIAQLRAGAALVGPEPTVFQPASAMAEMPVQAPTNILVSFNGVVRSVSGNILTLSTAASTTLQVAVTSQTTMVQEGALKDAATYQADIEKFHRQSDQLMQDPQQNQQALETLIAPSRNVETPITLAQLSPGAQIVVFTDGQNANAAYTAFRIIVTQALTQ